MWSNEISSMWHKDEVAQLYKLRTFQKQAAALDYLEEHNAKQFAQGKVELLLFGREITESGHRYFVVEDPRTFFEKYMSMEVQHRTFYEIIRGDRPCRLYFDIEFDKTLNPRHDGETSMKVFRERLARQLRTKLNFNFSRIGDILEGMVEFDSSTDKKFSRHLVVTLPKNVVFKHAGHVGVFVNELCNDIRKEAHSEELESDNDEEEQEECSELGKNIRKLFVLRKPKKKELKLKRDFIFDTSVYTRNRCFRLVLSAKYEDRTKRHFSVWQPSKKTCQEHSLLTYDKFLSSLACYVDWHKEQGAVITFSDVQLDEWRQSRKDPKSVFSRQAINRKNNSEVGGGVVQRGSKGVKADESQFPELIRYFMEMVKIWPKPLVAGFNAPLTTTARVTKWKHHDDDWPKLVISVLGNNYCMNVGRKHKGNGIYFVVDIENCTYFQKCHDQDCRTFRSDEIKLDPILCLKSLEGKNIEQDERGLEELLAELHEQTGLDSWHNFINSSNPNGECSKIDPLKSLAEASNSKSSPEHTRSVSHPQADPIKEQVDAGSKVDTPVLAHSSLGIDINTALTPLKVPSTPRYTHAWSRSSACNLPPWKRDKPIGRKRAVSDSSVPGMLTKAGTLRKHNRNSADDVNQWSDFIGFVWDSHATAQLKEYQNEMEIVNRPPKRRRHLNSYV